MKKMMNLLKDEEGVTAIEYALIAALIGVAIVATVTLVGNEVNATFNTVKTKLNDAQ